jgi:hypothetical protein
MKASTSSAPQNEHPPLARDAQGNLLALPDGTSAWRICRHTKGRPRIINGPDKQPTRFSLDTTQEDLADACGADTYRVYALDEVGNVIDYVTTVETSRELRNAGDSEAHLVPALRPASGGSDLRYALETISHIARVNADAMRAVAESQADWIKSISSARGFFRNAPPLQLAAAPVEEDESDDVEDEYEDQEQQRKNDWVEKIQPLVGVVIQQILNAFTTGKKPTGDQSKSKLALADVLDWRRAAKKSDGAPKAAVEGVEAIDPAALQQALASKAMAIAALLEPDERARLMRIAPMFAKLVADPEIAKLAAELVAKSNEDAAAWIRAHLAEIEKGLAS